MTYIKLKYKLIIITILNIVDYTVTQYILNRGGKEANIFLQPLVNTILFPILKIIIIPITIFFVWQNKDIILRKKYIQILLNIVFFAYIFLIIYYIIGFLLGLFY